MRPKQREHDISSIGPLTIPGRFVPGIARAAPAILLAYVQVALQLAERLIGGFSAAFDHLSRFAKGEPGRVVIAVLPFVAAALVTGVVADFQRSQAQADIQILDGLSESVVETG